MPLSRGRVRTRGWKKEAVGCHIPRPKDNLSWRDAPLRKVHACPDPATELPRHSILGRRRWSVCDKQVQSEHLGHPESAVHEAFTQGGGAESERRPKSVERQRP